MKAVHNTLMHSIAAGLDCLLAHQAADGSWTDWDLPPGSSSAWTTAYVGYRLCSLPLDLGAKATSHLHEASRWLLDNAFSGGGWGYNQTVGPDADSTAFAILFLTGAGYKVPAAAYAHLSRYQAADGGFSTYQSDGVANSWTVSHPDVTPIALLAWLTQAAPDPRVVERGIDYILAHRRPDKLWNSFWWDSCWYGTEASLTFLSEARVAFGSLALSARAPVANPFEAALLLSILLYADPLDCQMSVRELVERLVAQQQVDGSWATAPILRITRRDCLTPWASDDPGPLYADPHRLFTTATVLYALSRAAAHTAVRAHSRVSPGASTGPTQSKTD